MYRSTPRSATRSRSRIPISRTPRRSLSPISSSMKLIRAWSRDRLPLTASVDPHARSPESHWALATPKGKAVEDDEASSPTTPDTKAADRLMASADSRCYTSPRAVDLLMSSILEKRRANANYSPLRESSVESEVFSQSQAERQLQLAEERVSESVAAVTVKLLRLLSDISIPPKQLEKTLFSLLILCSEVDPTVEVGSNCKVMASRVWPAVKRYFQSPGQVVQAIRKLLSAVKKGSVSKRALAHAGEMVAEVREIRLREERGGNVGCVVLKVVKSVVDFAKVWDRFALHGRKAERPINDSRASISRSSWTPQASVFHSDDCKPRQLVHPSIPPSPPPKTAELTESPHSKLPISEDPAEAQHTRRKSLLEATLNWELEYLLRRLIMEKISTKEGSVDIITRDHLVPEFRAQLESNLSIRGSLDGPDGAWAEEVLTRFLHALETGSLYDLEVQRAIKLRRLEARMDEVGRTYQSLVREKEKLEKDANRPRSKRNEL